MFSSNHTEVLKLHNNKPHEVFLSVKPPKILLIFIHGFNGKAVSTWNKFPTMLPNNGKLEETDIAFYGYNSLQSKRGAAEYASDLLDFLNEEIPGTGNIARQASQKGLETSRQYAKIILVAHSLGAVLLRKALMGAKIDNKSWLNKTQMVLFAPAHLGAKVEKLLFGALDIILVTKLIGLGLKYKFPVLKDLESDSTLLKDLKDDSRKYFMKNDGEFAKAKIVIHSNPDGIVTNDRFGEDPQEIKIEGSSHTSVCKPNELYTNPLEQIISLL